jgi:hypothetical protein
VGEKIIIPYHERGGVYDWFINNGGFKTYTLAGAASVLISPDINNPYACGNFFVTLAKKLGYDDAGKFVNAFLAEVERSRTLYNEQEARQTFRWKSLDAAGELFRGRDRKSLGTVMGRAVEAVAKMLPADTQADIALIGETGGEEAVRDFILSRHFETVLWEMADIYTLEESDDTEPPEIQIANTFACPELINKECTTRQTFQPTRRRLANIVAKIAMQQPEGGDIITDEAAAVFVRAILKQEGPEPLRMVARRLMAVRLRGQRDTPLNKYEAAVMLWYQTHLDDRASKTDGQARDYTEKNNLSKLKVVHLERAHIDADTLAYLSAMRMYGSLAGQSLQALQLRFDNGFNIVNIYRQAFEDNGDMPLTPQQYAKLKIRVARLEKAWDNYVDAASLPDDAEGLNKRVAALEGKLAGLNAKRDRLQVEVTDLLKKQAALKAEHAKHNAEITAVLSEQRSRLQDQIDTLESEIAIREALHQEGAELHARVDRLTERMAILDAEYAGAVQTLLDSPQKQLADLDREHAEKQAKCEKAQESLKLAQERLARIHKLKEKLSKPTSSKMERRRVVLAQDAHLYGEFKAEMKKAQLARLAARWRGASLSGKGWMGVELLKNIILGMQSMPYYAQAAFSRERR